MSYNDEADPDVLAGIDELKKITRKWKAERNSVYSSPFYTLTDVMSLTGLSKSGIALMVSEGRFPNKRRIGKRNVRWVKTEVDAWIRDIINSN